ncbi:hypothetical protein HH214_15565 [Mucilaginibacter robiniae]|uniref:Uncharacterized protein n=1 Tax=Mucilaginibacter robiniae TaxID=2728022 RepID=A0A7L5E475_9SPHI|nr:hypothetical protein [Mucilaginibacter robiniae]QJD97187.1 hypothetical protein HH214_15565 [Mucilaginibacter robiniae]
MEVVLDQQQKPQGVFLPLSEWEQLRHGINKASELYKLMDELSEKDIFAMDDQEFKSLLAPVIREAVQSSLDQGLYFSYSAGIKDDPALFIHEYKDGKRVLIRVDAATGREHFVKDL